MAKLSLKSVLLIGVLIRIYLQFVTPSFNVDEIALGSNIKSRDIIGLLYPLDNFQSAPPLYLFIQKSLISIPIFRLWIKIKLLSLIVSISILILVYKLSTNLFKTDFFSLLFLSFFCFSPFVIYNTLTLKQYGLDLFFLIFVYIEFREKNKPKAVYFLLWCLLSNIGLFFTAGYLLVQFIDIVKREKKQLFRSRQFFNARNASVMLGPLIYILYFIWFMNQNGASEVKVFMQEYWANSFIPLNASILKYTLYFCNGIIVYFISSYVFLGLLIVIIAFLGLICSFSIKRIHTSNKFLIAGVFFHVVLNVLHYYPLSDRLYLYLALPIYLILSKGLNAAYDKTSRNWQKLGLYSATIALFVGYLSYLPYRENDVYSLFAELYQLKSKKVFYSSKTFNTVSDFNRFTDYKLVHFWGDSMTESAQGGLYVSRVHHKYGHEEKTATEEPQTLKLIKNGRLNLVHKVDGYNIYEMR
jgi:hypothetical protein